MAMNENILELLSKLKKKCIVNDETFMAKANLTHAEYHFFVVMNADDTIKSNLIAEKMELSLSRISRVVDKLVLKKLMTRKTDKKDRRVINLALTKSGITLKKEIAEYRKECEARITENISNKELEVIKESFNKILEVL